MKFTKKEFYIFLFGSLILSAIIIGAVLIWEICFAIHPHLPPPSNMEWYQIGLVIMMIGAGGGWLLHGVGFVIIGRY